MVIPGSDILGRILHAAAQCFLIPCIVGLLIFLLAVFAELGSFAAEWKWRRKRVPAALLETWQEGNRTAGLLEEGSERAALDFLALPPGEIRRLAGAVLKPGIPPEERKLAARQFLDEQEFRALKVLEKTDLIAKLGPILGLMGTLIPLGPGLAALGRGDLTALSQAVIIAFDTTVVGIAAGGIAFFISKVRRRWYERDLSALEVFLQYVLGGETDAGAKPKAVAAAGRRQ